MDLKEAMRKGKIIVGSKRTIKGILNGKIKEVYIAKNCPDEIRERLLYYSKLFGIKVNEFDGNNTDLGVFLGKPFKVAVVGIIHGED